MSGPRNNPLGSVIKCLKQKSCLYQRDNDLTFLECAPGVKFHIVVVVEEESGEKREYTVAIYGGSSQSGGPAEVPSAEISAGEPRAPLRSSERKKTTTTIGNHTSAPAGYYRPLKRFAPRGSDLASAKKLRTSNEEAISVTTSNVNDRQTSTRAPLRLRDTNSSPKNPLKVLAREPKSVPKLLPKPVSYQTAPMHKNDSDKEDKANEILGILMEAGTYANIPIQPGTETPELNSSIALYHKKTNARTTEMEQDGMILEGFLEEYEKLNNQDGYARVQEMGFYARYARFIWEFARKKGLAFEAAAARPTRESVTHGKWDVNRYHLSKALDEILQSDSDRIPQAKARILMKKTRKGEVLPRTQRKRDEALKLWRLGRNVLIIIYRAGPGAALCLALGPPHLQRHSMKNRLDRLPLSDMDFDDEGCMRSIQHNRHIFTAWLDARVDEGGRRWRQLLESVGVHIDDTIDPPRVQPGERYRLQRGNFNELTKTYDIKLSSPNESETYTLNGGIGEGSSGAKDWKIHLDCPAECRCLRCAVWKPPPVLIVETEIKNPNLGKTIVATQHLKPLDYIAEHCGERKTVVESMSAVKRREAEGQRIDRLEVNIPGQGTLFIHQERLWCVTRYPNHSKKPNAEFEREPEYVSGAYRTMLRVKPGCHIKPGDPVTVDYGDLYFEFGEEIYEGPGLLSR